MRFSTLAIALSTDDVVASRDFSVGHVGLTPVVELDWYLSLHHPEQVLDLVAEDHPSIPAGFRGRSADGVTLALLAADAR